MSGYTYIKGVTLGPAIQIVWQDNQGALIDFSTGWTFTVKIYAISTHNTLLATKTANITGSSGSLGYNVVIDWDTADHTALTADSIYGADLIATPTAGDPVLFPGTITFALMAPSV